LFTIYSIVYYFYALLPDQFLEVASGTGVRREMDLEVQKILTGDVFDLKTLYEYLAKEPIMTLNPLPKS